MNPAPNRRWLLWLVLAAVLALTFAAYLEPVVLITMANVWALCGF